MLTPKPIILTGHYIQLEPLESMHAETLEALSRDEIISTYSPALKLKFDKWFSKAIKSDADSRQLTFIVRRLADQKIIGSTRYYEIFPEHQRLMLGYTWYIPEVWGTVVNLECKLLLLQHAFEALQTNRVEFHIDSRNERSRRAVKKIGATEEGILRQHIVLDDGYIRESNVKN